MKVSESAARGLLEEMGKAKPDTPAKRILGRLNNIQTTIEDAEEPTGENAHLLKKIFDAVQEGEVIEFSDSSETPPEPEKSAEGTPTLEPPVEEPARPKRKKALKSEDLDKEESESKPKPKWSEEDIEQELTRLKKDYGKNVKGMIDEVKEYLASKNHLKLTPDSPGALAKLVLAKLRTFKGAPPEEEEPEPEEKPKKTKAGGKSGGKAGGPKDEFGNLLTSQGHLINKTLTSDWKSLDDIISESGLPRTRVKGHLNWLRDEKDLVEESEKGWRKKP